MEVWQILVTLGIIAFIAEIFTAGFISGSVGIGFFFAAAGSYFDLELKWLILLFSLGVALTYFLIRPVILKIGYRNSVKTNRDALIGRTGIVTEEIDNRQDKGRVKVDGDDWKARVAGEEVIPAGANVKIIAIESIVLIVEPLK
jgi:membrane protein implicated in regulation of membrane protease activity